MTWSCSATGHTEGKDAEREALEGILEALTAAHAGSITLVGNFFQADFEQGSAGKDAGYVLKEKEGA